MELLTPHQPNHEVSHALASFTAIAAKHRLDDALTLQAEAANIARHGIKMSGAELLVEGKARLFNLKYPHILAFTRA